MSSDDSNQNKRERKKQYKNKLGFTSRNPSKAAEKSSSSSQVPVLGKRIRKPSLLRREYDETNLIFSS